MEEAYEGGLNVIIKYGPCRRPQGLSEVEIVCISKNIIELYAPFLAASFGGLKTGMKSSASKKVPSYANGAFFFFFLFLVVVVVVVVVYLFIFRTSSSSSIGFFFFYRFLLFLFLGLYWVM